MCYLRFLVLSIVPVLVLSVPGPLIAQVPATSSSNFVLETFTISGGGDFTSSPNFQLNGSLGQKASDWSGTHFNLMAAGFWPAFGGGPLPIELRVAEGLAPGNVQLDWTAFFSNYQIFRSVNPNDVLANPLAQTPANGFEDTGADPFDVLFYLVEPGP